MRFSDILKLSLRMFHARTMRTLLTILGMSIGIATVLFLVSLGYGLQKTLLDRITSSDALATFDITENREHNAFIDEPSMRIIRSFTGVEEVIPAIRISGQGTFDSVTLDLDTLGTSPTFLRLEGAKILAGSLSSTQQNTVLITSGIAKIFKTSPEDILGKNFTLTLFSPNPGNPDKKITLEPKPLRIIGIIKNDANIAYFSPKDFPELNFTRYQNLKVKALDISHMDKLRTDISSLGFSVSSISDTVNQANKVFQTIQLILMIFGMVALVVSAIGMFNTMTITLLERTEEIGIMKSIGASRSSISAMFLVEATLMGFLGSLAGVALGWIAGKVCNILFNFIAGQFGGEHVELFSSPLWFIAVIIIFGSFVGFFTGIFPAQKASRIDPLDALRYK